MQWYILRALYPALSHVSVAHFWGITVLVAHMRKHPTYFTQHRSLASWGFVQVHQVKMLGYGLKQTSSLRESYFLAQGSFALRWPTSWFITVLQCRPVHLWDDNNIYGVSLSMLWESMSADEHAMSMCGHTVSMLRHTQFQVKLFFFHSIILLMCP